MNLFSQLSDPLLEAALHAFTAYAIVLENIKDKPSVVLEITPISVAEYYQLYSDEIKALHDLIDACDKEYTLRLKIKKD